MTQDPSDHSTSAASQTTPILNGFPAKTESGSLSSCSLYNVCLEVRKKVDSFLAEEPETALLRNVQGRVREAIGVVDEAFQRYEYVLDTSAAIFHSMSR
jgi:hypothetical protein